MLQEKLLCHGSAAETCLEALGFRETTIDGEAYFEHSGQDLGVSMDSSAPIAALHAGPLGRARDLIAEARQAVIQAQLVHSEHGIAYRIALELPRIRRRCAADPDLGQLLTHLLLENIDFHSHTTGVGAEVALPAILAMLRSREGVRSLVDYYTGWCAGIRPLHPTRACTMARTLVLNA